MNTSGDAAEQIVRISLEGMDYTIRLAGAGAKQLAALLVAAFKSPDTGKGSILKPSGKERLKTMLKSGQPLKIFGIKNKDLEQFAKEAKRYGVVYCALRDKNAKPNDLVDLMVRVEDSSKLDRILERLEFMSVDATVESAVEGKEMESPDVSDGEKLMAMLIDEDGKPKPDSPETEKAIEASYQDGAEQNMQNPLRATTESGYPSAPLSKNESHSEKAKSSKKPSVREFLRERAAHNRKQEEQQVRSEKSDSTMNPGKTQPQKQQAISHHPKQRKSKKTKERS